MKTIKNIKKVSVLAAANGRREVSLMAYAISKALAAANGRRVKKYVNLFCFSFSARTARTAVTVMIAMIAAGAFQACADVRSSAFFTKKESDKPKPAEEEKDLPICDDPATKNEALPGAGTTGEPFVLCRPAHMSLIGTTSTYALDKHYILGKNIALPDNESSPIGGPCGTSDAFTGSFDGRGKTISNIGFTSAAKDIYVKNVFLCPDPEKVKNINYSYALSDEDVCKKIVEQHNAELVTREDQLYGAVYCLLQRSFECD